jgi:hypothetical protein
MAYGLFTMKAPSNFRGCNNCERYGHSRTIALILRKPISWRLKLLAANPDDTNSFIIKNLALY